MRPTTFFWSRRKAVSVSSEGRIFTDYVRALSEGREPDPDLVQALEEALRKTLVSEMRRRGLWESPPGWLGVFGWERWEPRGSGPGGDGALEELLAECYAFIFVSRLRSLEAQLRIKPNIDGLVFLNIRHFLHERQKTHDPLGSQVFEVLQSAVRDAVEAGKLRVVEGDERIRNDTILAFGKEETGPGAAPTLRETVAAWNDELLPELVTLRGRRQEEVVRRLRDRLSDLREKGIESFRFKDLVDPMKADVRARWAAALELAGGEVAAEREAGETRVPLVSPDTGIEEQQLFRWLVACVLDRIERSDVNDKTRRYLLTLWNFLRIRAAGAPVAGFDLAEQEEESPSLRKISDLLHIPRERLPGLYKVLGGLLTDCRDASMAWNTARAFRPGEVST